MLGSTRCLGSRQASCDVACVTLLCLACVAGMRLLLGQTLGLSLGLLLGSSSGNWSGVAAIW